MDFRRLVWLQRSHGAVLRGLSAGAAWALVLALTGRGRLAGEAAGLFRGDRFKLGAHRLHWYLAHGWTGRRVRPPLFDPTSGMDARSLAALEDWLGDSLLHRLARLYVLARQDRRTEFAALATTLLPHLPAPNPTARDPKGADFTLDQAKVALASLSDLPQPWYVVSGTFLGAVREGTFLAHDYDIDIGIHAEDFDAAVFTGWIAAHPDLVLVNSSPHQTAGGPVRPALYRVLHANGIGIDVFIHHLEDGVRWHGSAKHRWDNSDFDLADYTIAGLPVRGPAEADRYLTENYGDWRTPVKRFNCSTGTPNVSFPRNLTAVAEHLRIAILRAGSAEAEVARLILLQEGYVSGQTFVIPW